MNLIQSTPAVNQAIQKASQLRPSLIPDKKGLKNNIVNGGFATGGTYTNGTQYLCEIVSQHSPGVYKVKAYLDFTDLNTYTEMYLTALDMGFDNVYYPGERLVATVQQVDSLSVAPSGG